MAKETLGTNFSVVSINLSIIFSHTILRLSVVERHGVNAKIIHFTPLVIYLAVFVNYNKIYFWVIDSTGLQLHHNYQWMCCMIKISPSICSNGT
jgi:hypothetical protein